MESKNADAYFSVRKDFAERLKALREAANMTQAELGKKLGVSRGSISYYEKMERVPDIVFLVKAAEYFGVPEGFLLGYSDNEKKEYEFMGMRLNLSDQALDFFSDHEEFGEYLSYMIETDYFEKLYLNCAWFINEETFRFYKKEYFSAYYADLHSVEEFISFLISKYFIEVLRQVRWSNLASKHSTDKTVEEILSEIDNKLQRIKDAQLMDDISWESTLSDEQDADLERRRAARAKAQEIIEQAESNSDNK